MTQLTSTPEHPSRPARDGPPARIALETTLLLHGVPRDHAKPLASRLRQIALDHHAQPMLVGVVHGEPIVGLSDAQLDELLRAADGVTHTDVAKLNSSNLGLALFRKQHGATTVSTTMELASRAGVHVFATGGIGGVHPILGAGVHTKGGDRPHLDISADLFAFTRFPVAVVTSGVKSILDVANTRELLETLGVPVVGFGTSDFPCFYLRASPDQHVNPVDARFDDVHELARFVRFELARTNRGIMICNPIPKNAELDPKQWNQWLGEAEARVEASAASDGHAGQGRDATPALLGALHEVSSGATLRANIALIESNTRLAAMLASAMASGR